MQFTFVLFKRSDSLIGRATQAGIIRWLMGGFGFESRSDFRGKLVVARLATDSVTICFGRGFKLTVQFIRSHETLKYGPFVV